MKKTWSCGDKQMPKYLKLFCKILKNEGLTNWHIRVFKPGGGLVIPESKTILTHANDLPLFLHEIAHCLTLKWNEIMGDGTGHHSIFADKYTALVRKYMKPKDY